MADDENNPGTKKEEDQKKENKQEVQPGGVWRYLKERLCNLLRPLAVKSESVVSSIFILTIGLTIWICFDYYSTITAVPYQLEKISQIGTDLNASSQSFEKAMDAVISEASKEDNTEVSKFAQLKNELIETYSGAQSGSETDSKDENSNSQLGFSVSGSVTIAIILFCLISLYCIDVLVTRRQKKKVIENDVFFSPSSEYAPPILKLKHYVVSRWSTFDNSPDSKSFTKIEKRLRKELEETDIERYKQEIEEYKQKYYGPAIESGASYFNHVVVVFFLAFALSFFGNIEDFFIDGTQIQKTNGGCGSGYLFNYISYTVFESLLITLIAIEFTTIYFVRTHEKADRLVAMLLIAGVLDIAAFTLLKTVIAQPSLQLGDALLNCHQVAYEQTAHVGVLLLITSVLSFVSSFNSIHVAQQNVDSALDDHMKHSRMLSELVDIAHLKKNDVDHNELVAKVLNLER